jgi:ABC-type oligopeptide transport system substrate-binding subunit
MTADLLQYQQNEEALKTSMARMEQQLQQYQQSQQATGMPMQPVNINSLQSPDVLKAQMTHELEQSKSTLKTYDTLIQVSKKTNEIIMTLILCCLTNKT